MARSRALLEAEQTFARLRAAHPDAKTALDHRSPFELLVATVLSAQTTDVNVNKATPTLFSRWPNAEALSRAEPGDVEKVIGSLGFFRQKTKSVIGLSKALVEKFGGEVPKSLAELVTLPGVGRKTANVVLGVAFNAPEGVVVDTHVQRLSQRLGWTKETEPEKIEQDLMRLFPREEWDAIGHTLIFHGRRICTAIRPACAACPVNDVCPSAFKAERVGRKPGRIRSDSRAPTKTTATKSGPKKTAASKTAVTQKTAASKTAVTQKTAASKSGAGKPRATSPAATKTTAATKPRKKASRNAGVRR
jgi:endonuclease-3